MAAPPRLLRAAAIVAVTLGVSASGLLAGLATPGLATRDIAGRTANEGRRRRRVHRNAHRLHDRPYRSPSPAER
jgi:hypothetical protein